MNILTLDSNSLLREAAHDLDMGYSVLLKPKGDSMFPFIKDGRNSVLLKKSGNAEVGDIVLARLSDNKHVLHRVYHKQNNELILMGDGNLLATEQCTQDNILGVVVSIYRKGKQVDCSSFRERSKATLWRWLLPLRRLLLFILKS